MNIQILICRLVRLEKKNVLFEKKNQKLLYGASRQRGTQIVLRCNTKRFSRHWAGGSKIEICCSNNSRKQSKTAMFGSSKLRFFDGRRKIISVNLLTQFARSLVESAQALRLLLRSALKSFLQAFSRKSENFFSKLTIR